MYVFNPSKRQRQENLSESEASTVYKASSRTARATQCNPVSKNKTKMNKNGMDMQGFFYTSLGVRGRNADLRNFLASSPAETSNLSSV